MTTFDTVVVLVLSMSLIYSLFRGMIREIFGLLSVVVGYLAALKYNSDLAAGLEKFIETEAVARVAAFALLFFAASTLVTLIGIGVRKVLSKSDALSGMDRVVGGIFGLIKGLLLVILAVAPLQWFPDLYRDITRDSVTAPYLKQATEEAKKVLNVEEGFLEKGLNQIKKLPESLPDAKEFRDLSETIKKKAGEIVPSSKEPQDSHPEESQKKLDEIIRSVTKD